MKLENIKTAKELFAKLERLKHAKDTINLIPQTAICDYNSKVILVETTDKGIRDAINAHLDKEIEAYENNIKGL